MKAVRRILAVIALLGIAVKGVLSFLSWANKQESHDSIWEEEEEELEESF